MKNQTNSIPTQTKITQNLYNKNISDGWDEPLPHGFSECLDFITKRGKDLFGQHFKIEMDDYEIIYKLVIYFLKRQDLATKYNINLEKGILLSGPVGSGKTLSRPKIGLHKNSVKNGEIFKG